MDNLSIQRREPVSSTLRYKLFPSLYLPGWVIFFKVKEVKEDAIEIGTAQGTKEIFNYVDSHQITIDNKVKIILDHFFNKSSKEIQGKSRGMIVVKTRKLCVKYFKEINHVFLISIIDV